MGQLYKSEEKKNKKSSNPVVLPSPDIYLKTDKTY
jgi:hypothetical protein